MLRWAAGIMHMDDVRNDAIRQRLGLSNRERMGEARCDGAAMLFEDMNVSFGTYSNQARDRERWR